MFNLCKQFHSALHLIHVGDEWFADAPTLRYYSRVMYYRLLAAQLLPKDMDRILYLVAQDGFKPSTCRV